MFTQNDRIDTAPLLTPAQAAETLGISTGTLAIWRSTRRYPLRYIKVGGKVRYRRSDIDSFLELRTVGQK